MCCVLYFLLGNFCVAFWPLRCCQFTRRYLFVYLLSFLQVWRLIFLQVCGSVPKSCPTLLRPCGLWPNRLLCPWDFPNRNTGVGCHFFLQEIFQTQGWKLFLLRCRWFLALHADSLLTESPGKPYLSSSSRKWKLHFLSLLPLCTFWGFFA